MLYLLDTASCAIRGASTTLGATLVSNNRKHFQQVKMLSLENWTE